MFETRPLALSWPFRASDAHVTLLFRAARWLQTRSFPFTPDQIGITEGLRAATIVAVMVVATHLLGNPLLAWGAFAAFWTCLADPAGPDRLRLRVMGGFVLAGSVVAPLMAWVGGLGPQLAAPALFALVIVCGLARFLGPEAAQAGVLASVVAVVAIDQPMLPAGAAALGAVFFAGGVLALAVCIALWRIHPHRPARRAVSAIFVALGQMTAGLAAAAGGGVPPAPDEHRRAVRSTIERAQARIDQVAAGRGGDGVVHAQLMAAVDAADRVFAGLIALEHVLDPRHGGSDGSPIADLLRPLRQALALAARQAPRSEPDWASLRGCADTIGHAAEAAAGLPARVASAWARALSDLAEQRPPAREAAAAVGSTLAPAQASLAGPVVRHALRVAVVVLIAYLITDRFALPYSYWATMAAVVVMQPQTAETWPRMLERVIGSIVGGLAAAALGSLAAAPWALILVVFPLATATIALRSVNYTLFVLFLTPLFVLVADLIAPGHGEGVALARAANNVLGSVLAFVGTLVLWPQAAPRPLSDRVADAVEANVAYAGLVTQPDVAAGRIEAARRKAGLYSNAAEEMLQRLRLEGRRAHLDEAAALLATLRRLAGAATVALLQGGTGQPAEGLDRLMAETAHEALFYRRAVGAAGA